jgi:hypothetical protein
VLSSPPLLWPGWPDLALTGCPNWPMSRDIDGRSASWDRRFGTGEAPCALGGGACPCQGAHTGPGVQAEHSKAAISARLNGAGDVLCALGGGRSPCQAAQSSLSV